MPGPLLCLASAAAFGGLGIFGKLAYDEGATAGTLLAARFALAAVLLWGLAAATGGLAVVRSAGRRAVLTGLALGAVGYAAQAGCFFLALERLDASLLSLVLYTYPALVVVAAVLLGRERADGRRSVALVVASAGLALVLAGAGTGAVDTAGVLLGVAAAAVYTTYILVSDRTVGALAPLTLSALVCTGAVVTLTAGALAAGDLRPGAVTAAGAGWLAALAVVSTVGAIALFFAGLARVGPSTASILSTAEPVVTVAAAWAVFGEALTPVQLAGGALVVGAAAALSRPPRPAAAPAPVAPRAAARGLLRARRAAARAAAPR
ncbi:MAG TPA: EamA family transporter [Baekduia sp.]|nr:EamA family transporter [Baekduia sp.]